MALSRDSGFGVDIDGPFTVRGTLVGDRLAFCQEYQTHQDDELLVWRSEGVVLDEADEIRGQWGPCDDDWESSILKADAEYTDLIDMTSDR